MQQSGGRHVSLVHQHARRKTGKTDGLIHVLYNARGNSEPLRPDTHLVARAQLKTTHQALICPHCAGQRNAISHMQAAIIDLYLAAQRITRLHRLNLGQQHPPLMRHHAGKRAALYHAQAAQLGHFSIIGRDRARRRDAQIRAQQTGRLLTQRLLHPVGEQSDRSETSHRQHQRQQQYAPLPCPPVAAQEIKGQAEKIHFIFTALPVLLKGATVYRSARPEIHRG